MTGGGEPSGTTFASDQQPHALSGPAGAGSDVSHRHEAGIGNPDHFDTIQVLDVGDRRQDGFLQAGRCTFEVQVLRIVDLTHQRIITARLLGVGEGCLDVLLWMPGPREWSPEHGTLATSSSLR